MTEVDERELRGLAQQLWDGWNGRSGDTFAAPFAEDADYVVVDGLRIKGRGIIAAGHQQVFDTIYHDSQIQGEVESVRLLRPDVALVHVRNSLSFTPPGAPQPKDVMSRSTLVCAREDGRWQIVSFQNTEVVTRPGMPSAEDVIRMARKPD
jgi:uncharacterized protein (TIGR02246 family)